MRNVSLAFILRHTARRLSHSPLLVVAAVVIIVYVCVCFSCTLYMHTRGSYNEPMYATYAQQITDQAELRIALQALLEAPLVAESSNRFGLTWGWALLLLSLSLALCAFLLLNVIAVNDCTRCSSSLVNPISSQEIPLLVL